MIGPKIAWKLLKLQRQIIPTNPCFFSIPKQVTSLYTTVTTLAYQENNTVLQSNVFSTRNASRTFGNHISTYNYNKQMAELGRIGKLKLARELFDKMPERDACSYSTMVNIYLKNNEFPKAEKLYMEIPECMRGVVVNSTMVNAYAKAGQMDRAKKIFDEMPERNAFTWTNLISGYFGVGKVDEALDVFWEMPEIEKNEFTWTNVIMGFARNGMINEAHHAFGLMPGKNVVTWTSMVKVYVDNNRIDEAFRLFCEMPERNLYAWNIMIGGFLDSKRVDDAKRLFDSLPWRNAISWSTMVTGLARNGMIKVARDYFDQMPVKDIAAWNAMITAYTNDGRLLEANELFKRMSQKNIVTWNAILDGYAKDKQEDEVFKHFILMLCSGINPNETSLTSLLTSCSGILGVLQVHALIIHLGFDTETSLANTLINMYCRSGDFTSSRITFENLEAKDAISWTSMILAYSNHGFGIQALQAFAQMLRSGHLPDEITFVVVLSACSHAGLVKKGQMFFDSIKTAYDLEPTPEHYSCLVDLLGRSGLVHEAMKVVEEMPREKCDSAVLGALVGACRLHGYDGLADHIGDKLIELDPDSSGEYVLLANVYAASGRWDKFSQLRKKMKEREVLKVPGYSQVEVNGKSHVFLAGGRSHPDMKNIYMLLQEKLLPIMQDKGNKFANLYSSFCFQHILIVSECLEVHILSIFQLFENVLSKKY